MKKIALDLDDITMEDLHLINEFKLLQRKRRKRLLYART